MVRTKHQRDGQHSSDDATDPRANDRVFALSAEDGRRYVGAEGWSSDASGREVEVTLESGFPAE